MKTHSKHNDKIIKVAEFIASIDTEFNNSLQAYYRADRIYNKLKNLWKIRNQHIEIRIKIKKLLSEYRILCSKIRGISI